MFIVNEQFLCISLRDILLLGIIFLFISNNLYMYCLYNIFSTILESILVLIIDRPFQLHIYPLY